MQGLLDPEDGGIMFPRNDSICQSTKREELNLQDENFAERIIWFYTGCPRRNVPNFGKVFLILNYTDITQNTYVQS